MPLAYILAGLVTLAAVGITVYLWPRIMGWAREHILPWIDEHVPALADAVRQAFLAVDKVAVAMRNAIHRAWQRLRTALLKQVLTYHQLARNRWVARITTFLMRQEQREKPVVKLITEQEVAWEDLPADVRAQMINGDGLHDTEVDIVAARDRLLAETV